MPILPNLLLIAVAVERGDPLADRPETFRMHPTPPERAHGDPGLD
jgi:hypothetical protein